MTDFSFRTLAGAEKHLADYQGKALLVVNVASKCGYTPQYQGLEKLHEEFNDKGLAVVGFPCNQFGGQEPGSTQDIQDFCTTNYGVKFDMMEKVDVNGAQTHPFYQWLKENAPVKGEVQWNFEKFLIDKKGAVVGRYKSGVTPESSELKTAIEKAIV
jgi:glutathione peroxidase